MKRPGLILAIVCLPVFLGALDLTIISAVLPAVVADLDVPLQTGLDEAAWAVTGYLLAYAVSMTFMGRISDLWGRRRVYLLCLAVFFIGSWWVAASPGWPAEIAYRVARLVAGGRPDHSLMALYALIFGRVVQAFGAGAMVPVSMALAADLFPPERRALPLGLIGAVDTAGWVLGHLYGGIMVQYFAWPVLFWINLPLIVLMFGLTAWAFRGLAESRSRVPMDWIGVLWITLALTGLNLGLAAGDTGAGISPVPMAFALVTLAAFIIHELRTPHPLLNLRLYRNRNISASSVLNLIIGFCLMAGLVSVPLFINLAGAQNAGQGALVSGYLLSAFTVPLAIAALPGGWLTGRIGYRLTTLAGLGLALCGFRIDDAVAIRDGRPGRGVFHLRRFAGGAGIVADGRGPGPGGDRAGVDDCADRHGGDQRRGRIRARDRGRGRHHPAPRRDEPEREPADDVRPAADDGDQHRIAPRSLFDRSGADRRGHASDGDARDRRDGVDRLGGGRGGADPGFDSAKAGLTDPPRSTQNTAPISQPIHIKN